MAKNIRFKHEIHLIKPGVTIPDNCEDFCISTILQNSKILSFLLNETKNLHLYSFGQMFSNLLQLSIYEEANYVSQ